MKEYFLKIDSEEKAYWLGFIAADGCVTFGGKHGRQFDLRVSLATKDREHLDKLRNFLGITKPLQEEKRKYTSFLLRVCSKQLIENLMNFGVTPKKTFSVRLPQLDKSLVRHWIRGYFDGDGHWNLSKDGQMSFGITSGSEKLLLEIQQELVENCGLPKTKLIAITPNCKRLLWKGNSNCKTLHNYLYKNCSICLERKFNISNTHIK